MDGSGRVVDMPSVIITSQAIVETLHKKLQPGIYTVRAFAVNNKQPVYGRIFIAPH